MEHGSGKALRYSTTVHSNYMYITTRLPEGFLRLAMPLTAMEGLVRELRKRLFYASLIALVLTLVFSYAVAQRISRPIREIALGAGRLATGDLDYRLPARGNDEIAALGSALNTMAQNLSSKMQELSEGKERLERTEKMRRDFVANVSHEFKTPLTSIRGYAETLLEGADENPDVRRNFLTVIERNARQLESLVRDLLTLAKIEAELPARKERVEVQTLIEEQVLARQAAMEEREIKVAVQCPAVTLQADRSRLAAAISNLIDNAIHYNRRGGEIRVSGRLENGRGFALDIADTGYGIPEQELPRIFERFYRVDKARSRESGGTGLGLAIARHAIESQGGKITVASTVGKGSTFTIRLAHAADRKNETR
jgi:two-component system phosphate regulon sensor histidine kinase PhoR